MAHDIDTPIGVSEITSIEENIDFAIREVLFPYLRHNHPNSDLLKHSEDEFIHSNVEELGKEAQPGIPAALIWTFAINLTFRDSTLDEWALAYHQIQNWYADLKRRFPNQGGAPEKNVERLAVFAFVGYLTKIKGQPLESACFEASQLFKLPLDRVELWCIKKHRYAEERVPVDEFIEIVRVFRQGSEDEQEAFLQEKIPSLFKK